MEAQIDGIAELERAMKKLPSDLQQFVFGAGCQAMAKVVLNNARAIVPVDKGALKKSIRVKRTPDRNADGKKIPRASAVVIMGGKGAYHAHLIELGTVHMEARDVLKRAVSANAGEQLSQFSQATEKEFVEVVKKLATRTQTQAVERLIR